MADTTTAPKDYTYVAVTTTATETQESNTEKQPLYPDPALSFTDNDHPQDTLRLKLLKAFAIAFMLISLSASIFGAFTLTNAINDTKHPSWFRGHLGHKVKCVKPTFPEHAPAMEQQDDQVVVAGEPVAAFTPMERRPKPHTEASVQVEIIPATPEHPEPEMTVDIAVEETNPTVESRTRLQHWLNAVIAQARAIFARVSALSRWAMIQAEHAKQVANDQNLEARMRAAIENAKEAAIEKGKVVESAIAEGANKLASEVMEKERALEDLVKDVVAEHGKQE